MFLRISSDDGDVAAAPSNSGPADLPVGTKMRVRYGRGRNQREYEAKVGYQCFTVRCTSSLDVD